MSVTKAWLGLLIAHCFAITCINLAYAQIMTKAVTQHVIPPSPYDKDASLFGQHLCMDPSGESILISANRQENWKGAAHVFKKVHAKSNTLHPSKSEKKPASQLAKDEGQSAVWKHAGRLFSESSEAAEEPIAGKVRIWHQGDGLGFNCVYHRYPDGSAVALLSAPGYKHGQGIIRVFRPQNSVKTSKSAPTSVEEVWVEDTQHVIYSPANNTVYREQFGWSLVASKDAQVLAVSAKGHDRNIGTVFVYSCNDLKSGPAFSDCKIAEKLNPSDLVNEEGPEKLKVRNSFGVDIAMDAAGRILVVGSTGFMMEAGIVYVFTRDSIDNPFMLSSRLLASKPKSQAYFGYKVAISAKGIVIAVGADGEDDYAGAVYLYIRDHVKGMDQVKTEFEFTQRLALNNRQMNDNFGGSIALNDDGRLLLVGAPGIRRNWNSNELVVREKGDEDYGGLFIYQRIPIECGTQNYGPFQMTNYIQLSDQEAHKRNLISDSFAYSPESGDLWAWDVAISENGKTFAASAPQSRAHKGLISFGFIDAADKGLCGVDQVASDGVNKESNGPQSAQNEKEDL